jgi:hypothetical protein
MVRYYVKNEPLLIRSGEEQSTVSEALCRRRILTTARTGQGSTNAHAVYMAVALGWDDWTGGVPGGLGHAPRQLVQATPRCGVPAVAPGPGGDAAGREGLWRPRFRQAHGVPHVVVEASSLAVHQLQGARPADLPIEHPTTCYLAVHRRTAKALGLTIPPSLLACADP